MKKLHLFLFMPVLSCLLAAPAFAARTYIDATNEVAINGESFFGASNIRDELTRLARRDSIIAPTGTFRQIAVSGALISQIQGYYKNAVPKPKYVISDGGGNDLMSACPTPASSDCPVVQTTFNAVRVLFDSMAAGGTQRVLWMRYPDPQGTSWATLKTNQDLFNPLVKTLCETIKSLKCFWIDLRPVWAGHYTEYTSDGIHATNAGGTATAEAFWKVIVDSNFFEATVTSIAPSTTSFGSSGFSITAESSGLKVGISKPGFHRIIIQDLSGREIARRQGNGPANLRFGEAKQAGLYFIRITVGNKTFVRKIFAGSRTNF